MPDNKKVLMGLNVAELCHVAETLGLPKFTGRQIAQWLYTKHVTSIDEMTNISKANRQRLSEQYTIGAMPPIDKQESVDGTIKYLFPVNCSEKAEDSRLFVETVFIPDQDRATLCVSCQVGCQMNCLFCQTGKQGFQGNLTAGDILNQIYSLPQRERLTNIVFMGQGEPMNNLESILRVTSLLTDTNLYAWSPKRITVSSVGVPKKLQRFLEESQCHVAISLHSPLHEQRLQLMPAEKLMPIAEIVGLLKQHDFTHQRRCSFEYICFSGLNDTPNHARQLIRLLKGLECRVNLIRFHQIPGIDLPPSDERNMERLRDYLTQNGIFTTIRASRGQDIYAACGLLSTARQTENSNN